MTFIELPSISEIEQMEITKAKMIAALEFDSDNDNKQFVRCQNCGLKCRMFEGKSNLRSNDSKRINALKRKIQFAKTKAKFHKHYDKIEIVYTAEQQEDERELKALLEEQRQTEILTRLPLQSTKMTGFRWVCSTCYDKFYLDNMHNIHHVCMHDNNKQKI